MIRRWIQAKRAAVRRAYTEIKTQWRRLASPLRHWFVMLGGWAVLVVVISGYAVWFVQKTLTAAEPKALPEQASVTIPQARMEATVEWYARQAPGRYHTPPEFTELVDPARQRR